VFKGRACRGLLFGALLKGEPGVTCQKLGKFMNIMLAWALGGWEIVLILAIVLILFGAKKLPELAKGLGTGIKEFKKATREVTDEVQKAAEETPAPPNKSAAKDAAQPAQTVSQSSPPPKA
jgi:sec-independent protein translocase protein TatA